MSWPSENDVLGMPDSGEESYGTVTISENGVTIEATQSQLYAWAHRPGAWWPCSGLAEIEDTLTVEFDSNGLLDITGDDEADIMGDELSAWAADVLRDTLPPDHPAYFVTVGQFAEPYCAYCSDGIDKGPYCGNAGCKTAGKDGQ